MITLQKIEHTLKTHRPKLRFSQRFEAERRSNFMNFIKKVEGENGTLYVMKLPKLLSDFLCFLRIGIFHLLGDRAIIYGSFPERMKNEKEKVRLLNEKGVASLPLEDVDVEGVFVTRFVKGKNLKDVFFDDTKTLEEKLEILARAITRLEDIHAYFSHGDAQVRNILLTEDNETIWLDYEYISNPDMPEVNRKARDLVYIIFSAAKHLGCPEKVVKAVFDAYKEDEIKKAVFSLRPNLSIPYNLFLNLLPPALCRETRRIVKGELDSII